MNDPLIMHINCRVSKRLEEILSESNGDFIFAIFFREIVDIFSRVAAFGGGFY